METEKEETPMQNLMTAYALDASRAGRIVTGRQAADGDGTGAPGRAA